MSNKVELWSLSLLIVLANLLDWVLTRYILVETGGTEINPIINMIIMHWGLNYMLLYKLIVAVVVCYICILLNALSTLRLLFWCMATVCIYMIIQVIVCAIM